MSAERKKVILVVGRSGNGKSSCVRSIETLNETDLLPLECTGVGDTGEDLTEDEAVVRQNVEKIVEKCEAEHDGVDAILLVLKYGVRFTKQEKDAVAVVKSVFGENIFTTRGIIAFTYGDNFESDYESRGQFIDWCKEQMGDIKNLFIEVEYRCVLFNNKSKLQVSEIVNLVINISKQPNEKYKVRNLSWYKYSTKETIGINQKPTFIQWCIEYLTNGVWYLCPTSFGLTSGGNSLQTDGYFNAVVSYLCNIIFGASIKPIEEDFYFFSEEECNIAREQVPNTSRKEELNSANEEEPNTASKEEHKTAMEEELKSAIEDDASTTSKK